MLPVELEIVLVKPPFNNNPVSIAEAILPHSLFTPWLKTEALQIAGLSLISLGEITFFVVFDVAP